MNRLPLYDAVYDVTAQDLELTAGDLSPWLSSYYDIFSQSLVDALESQFNSMKHILKLWGFEGRNDVYDTVDNIPKQKAMLFIEEVLNALQFLFVDIESLTPNWSPSGFTGFEVRIVATLADILRTPFDRTLKWDQNTKRASIV